MSSMLDEAVIDANALKEAALKSAENTILEKYAGEVKNALNTLLEQEEDDLGLDDVGMEMGPDMGAAETGMDLPLAATDGENMCPCPEEEEEIEIDFDELQKHLQAEEEPEDSAELGDELGLDIGMDDEEIELDEAVIKALISEEVEEVNEEKDGEEDKQDDELAYGSEGECVPEQQHTTIKNSMSDVKTESLIKEATSEVLKLTENKSQKLLKEYKHLENKMSNVLKENKKIKSENDNFRTTIEKMSDKMEEINVSNAKLYYTNRVLKSDSLNERQKQAIAEAISEAGSVDEAKVIYETLESTVGNLDNNKKKPKSLREAVSRNSTILTATRREKPNKKDDLVKERFQRLAGLK